MTPSAPARLGVIAVLASLGTVGGIGLLAAQGQATAAGAARPPTGPGDPVAVRLLRQAATAAGTTPYSGVQYLSSWDADGGSTSVVVEINHVPGQGSVVQVRPTPGRDAIRVFEGAKTDGSPGLGRAEIGGGREQALALLERNFDVRLGQPDSVAGRPTRVVEARRPDGSLAARLWLDAATGLLLRREITDGRGRMTRASAFVDLRVGSRVLPTLGVGGPQSVPQAWDGRLAPTDLSVLREQGWAVPATLPGGLDLYDARRRVSDGDEVVHLSFSDGLSTVSLFEQRGRLDARQLGSWRREQIAGASVYLRDTMPQRLVWASRGKVYTVLADAPAETVAAVIRRLPHSSAPAGVLSRIARGLARVGSWLNPFA